MREGVHGANVLSYRGCRNIFSVLFLMDSFDIYKSIIERTMEQMVKTKESASVRLETVDAIKRKWVSNLEVLSGRIPDRNSVTSDPTLIANRAKYLTYPGTVPKSELLETIPKPEESAPSEDDEFEDDFGDAEIIHTPEVGRKMAEVGSKTEALTVSVAPTYRKPSSSKKREIINPETLDDESLYEADYDTIPEPSDCAVRVFGQTEVCETVVGPRRSDSRWIVTVLNGFVKTKDGKETLFRTAKQVMPHLHQHS
jgi:hypothetical protein